MTLAELDLKLPNGNGFHDSYITSLKVDYARRELLLGMKLLFGDPDNPVHPKYRDALIKMIGLQSLVVEAPGFLDGEPLQVTNSGENWMDVIDSKIINAVNGSSPFYSFYISNWQSCIHIAATDATYEWADDKT